MSPHQIVIVAVRLIAVFWLLHVLSRIGNAVIVMQEVEAPISRLWVLVAVQGALCAFLWFFPATVASRLLRSDASMSSQEPVDFAQWQQLALVAVGVLIFALAVPDAVYWGIVFTAAMDLADHHQPLGLEQKASAFATLLELLIGLGIALGARGLRAAIFKLRAAGLQTSGG